MTLNEHPLRHISSKAWTWVRQNLMSTWYNGVLTLICLWLLYQGLRWGVVWATTQADWQVIPANLSLFFVGQFPPGQIWRLWLILMLVSGLGGLSWGNRSGILPRQLRRGGLLILGLLLIAAIAVPLSLPLRVWILAVTVTFMAGFGLGYYDQGYLGKWIPLAWVFVLLAGLWLIRGGLGLKFVPTNLWSGLLLTLLTAILSILLSFPLGVLLALGRQSQLFVIRGFCILYIEIIRGFPLIGILFTAQVMLPLFLPVGTRPDRVVRAIAGLVLFSAAYLAENVRGGLQSIPRGQVEAARALGLNPVLVVWLIVLPQALRAVIPAIVGQFIGLFKDTSLLAIVGLVELTGIARSILANPNFLGDYAEVYLFVGLIYWVFCMSMSLASRRLEQQLSVREQ